MNNDIMDSSDTTDVDRELRELFAAYKPELPDRAAFNRRLALRLEAAEYIRDYQKKQKRLLTAIFLFTLLVGIALGCITMMLSSVMPPIPDIDLSSFSLPVISGETLETVLLSVMGAFTVIAAAGICTGFMRWRQATLPRTLTNT